MDVLHSGVRPAPPCARFVGGGLKNETLDTLLGVAFAVVGVGFLLRAVHLFLKARSSGGGDKGLREGDEGGAADAIAEAAGAADALTAGADGEAGSESMGQAGWGRVLQLGRGTASPAQPQFARSQDGRTVGYHHVRSLDERVALIRERVRAGGLNPDVHLRAAKVLSRKCQKNGKVHYCTPEKDWIAEQKTLFNAMRDPAGELSYRYVRDMLRADTNKGAHLAAEVPGGDCDDSVIVLGSMLESVGHPVKLRVVQTDDEADFNHIYLLAGSPADGVPTHWLPLDPTVDEPPGWQVPGADTVARTGRPSGRVKALKDFDI